MTSKERVLAALRLEQPDRIPWVEHTVHNGLVEKLLQSDDFEKATVFQSFAAPGLRIPPIVPDIIALDNHMFSLAMPRYVKTMMIDGVETVYDGLIKTDADLENLVMPDPNGDAFYQQAKKFISLYRDSQRALGVLFRLGASNTFLSMGIEHFSYMLYDNPKLVLRLLDTFVDWACKVAEKINGLGFDFMIVPEDLAWEQGPLFSPNVIRELFIPRMKKVAERIKLPWIYHSDGNFMPIIDDLLTLGMNCLANIEPSAMDICELKKKYGQRVCIMGNIDLDYTLTRGTPEETEAEVKERIQELGPGGGYILASSNALTNYCKPENVLAMSQALLKYGKY